MALSADMNTIVLNYALDEDPFGEEDSSIVERFGNGYVRGEQLPTGSYRHVFFFHGISNKEEYIPTPATDADTRKVMDQFYAGGELRVYRDFPADLTAWTETNSNGYSDVTASKPGDEMYLWRDNVMARSNFEIVGVEV
jgi:hypothetical protein